MTEQKEQPLEPIEVKKPEQKPQGLGLDQNLSAVLAYLFLAFGGILFYVLEKENKYIRFAAMQSILLTVVVLATFFIGGLFAQPITQIGGLVAISINLIWTFYVIGIIVVWALLMYKAFNGEEWELPVLGKMARDTIK